MTLILSLAAPGLVAQVSDRQVTRMQRGRPARIHSPVENKTIIFIVRDAVGVLGYTGSAYVDGRPTDEWLAMQIAQPSPSAPSRFAIQLGGKRPRRLNDVIWRIRRALEGGGLRRSEMIAICISGFRVRRHRTIPFLVEFGWPSGWISSELKMRRPTNKGRAWCLSQIGDIMPWDDLVPRFHRAVPEADAAGEHPFIGAMSRLVRSRAAVSELVGANLMAVTIPHPRQRRVDWEFIPAEQHLAAMVSPNQTLTFDAAYSPWIIAPGIICQPSVGTGHHSVHSGGWRIAPIERRADVLPHSIREPGRRLFFAMSSQERTRPPR